VVWTMPSPCITQMMFRREPSRLYTLSAVKSFDSALQNRP
jgi:hypothetical protein